MSLDEPIRYAAGDAVESWLHSLLCLDAAAALPTSVGGCPHPSECELYWVDRDALFSYHSASEAFLQRMVALFVASHYKNSPNDLQLMSDAPAHQLYVLLGPVDKHAAKLPEVLAAVQLSLEGDISREVVQRQLARGEAPSGDLIPWTISQQFQESSFASLSGARVVRVAVHPEMQHMGYGSRALDQLVHYFSGEMGRRVPSTQKPRAAAPPPSEGGGLLSERLAPRRELPPLLQPLTQRPAEALDWLGASFGVTEPLFNFWHKAGFVPVYVRQTTNETTGENTAVMIRSLASDDDDARWLRDYADDFRRRISSLLSLSLRSLPCGLALSLLGPSLGAEASTAGAGANGGGSSAASADGGTLSAEQIDFLIPAHDLKRLRAYARSLVDYRLVVDLIPTLARLRFTGRLHIPLSAVQAAIFVGVGLQAKSFDDLGAELGLPVAQLLALFNKTVRKLVAALTTTLEEAEGATLPTSLDDELDAGASASLAALQEKQQQQQRDWIADGDLAKYAIQGTDADWEAALKGGTRDGAPPRTVSVKGADAPKGDGAKEGGGKKAKRSGKEGGAKAKGGKRKRG